jgi:transposase
MEGMGKKPRRRRSFTPEFKAEIVELCQRGGRLTSDERQELAESRRENRRLREDVGILKRATAFFAKETR